MKKNYKYLLFISFFAIVLMFGSTSCKDDTECKMIVVAKLFSDTTVAVPNAFVTVEKNDVKVSGITNAMGEFDYSFALEAILDVTVRDTIIDTIPVPPILVPRIGEGSIRLKPGETVRKVILIK